MASQRDLAERTQKNVDHHTEAVNVFPGESSAIRKLGNAALCLPRDLFHILVSSGSGVPKWKVPLDLSPLFSLHALDFHADCELIL